jgi:hypothetical protein
MRQGTAYRVALGRGLDRNFRDLATHTYRPFRSNLSVLADQKSVREYHDKPSGASLRSTGAGRGFGKRRRFDHVAGIVVCSVQASRDRRRRARGTPIFSLSNRRDYNGSDRFY